MAIHYNTSHINQADLVYHIDFRNPKSYPGSGTNLYGLANTLDSTYNSNSGALVYDPVEKAMVRAAVNSGIDSFRSSSNVILDPSFTMHALVKVSGVHTGTANGVITNHSHIGYTGAGITICGLTTTDFRISCNTGTGAARTYNTYYGATNIYNIWAFLTLRFVGTAFTLWVNNAIDYSGTYAQLNDSQPIDLFNWSTTNIASNSYRPACKMSMASVYNRALTDDEIKTNFNLYRGRYGL